jgi:hypothetical protein
MPKELSFVNNTHFIFLFEKKLGQPTATREFGSERNNLLPQAAQ